jgi:hypothetical protein
VFAKLERVTIKQMNYSIWLLEGKKKLLYFMQLLYIPEEFQRSLMLGVCVFAFELKLHINQEAKMK